MTSKRKKTKAIRNRKQAKQGKKRKRAQSQASTPAFTTQTPDQKSAPEKK